jgi:hypothetical protein
MEKVLEDKEFYYSMYNKKLVDKAFDYLKDSGSLNDAKVGAQLALEEKICKDMSYEERGAHFNKINLSTYMFAYLHGALENAGIAYEDMLPDRENSYSDYRKNKDFCVFFYFGDNDFGEYVREGAEMICDEYNSKLFSIDSYKINPIWKPENSLYVKDINEIEKLENIQKALAYGIISAAIKNNGSYALTFADRGLPDPKEVTDKAYGYVDYLKVNDDSRYKIGTYKEVENWVFSTEKWSWKEGDSLENMWFNGEALIIAMKDGEMKCWIK